MSKAAGKNSQTRRIVVRGQYYDLKVSDEVQKMLEDFDQQKQGSAWKNVIRLQAIQRERRIRTNIAESLGSSPEGTAIMAGIDRIKEMVLSDNPNAGMPDIPAVDLAQLLCGVSVIRTVERKR